MKNDRIKDLQLTVLSDNWYVLRKAKYQYLNDTGGWEEQEREAYDRGNGAVILLYNKERQTIILTRQFRLPTFLNGNEDGMLLEACAGLLDGSDPKETIIRETEEETGYRIHKVEKTFEAYMSPGSVTEILYFYIAEYFEDQRVNLGGGLSEEQENIEVVELSFKDAYAQIETGELKDAKTIMLIQYLALKGVLRL